MLHLQESLSLQKEPPPPPPPPHKNPGNGPASLHGNLALRAPIYPNLYSYVRQYALMEWNV